MLLNTAPSGGIRPVSGFTLDKHGLTAVPGSTRFLNAGATDAEQIRCSPAGDVLVVTGRSANRIDTFRVDREGLLSDLESST